MPPGRTARRRRSEDPCWSAASSRRRLGRRAPAQVGPSAQRAQARARRVDEDAVEALPVGRSRASPCTTRTFARASARTCSRSCARPARRRARRPRPRPRRSISAARCVVLPPGAAHRSSTRSPGRGPSARRDEHRGARLGHDARPPRTAREPAASNGGPEHDGPSGSARRVGPARPSSAATSSASATSVLTRAARLGGLVVGGHQRARRVRAELLPPQLGDPRRVRVRAARAAAGVSSGSAATSAARPRARRGAGRR